MNFTSTITKESMYTSYSSQIANIGKRQREVYLSLKNLEHSTTVWELVMHMWKSRIIPRPDRNLVHPRLNELIKINLVQVVGKRECEITGRVVALYNVKESAE